MGVVALSKVTVIAPRSDYQDVVRKLAQFEEFHPVDEKSQNFDPAVQGLAVRAVKLFAQADQTVKDLSIPLAPGTLDIVFRGVKIPESEIDAKDWNDLLTKAENQLDPIVGEVGVEKTALQRVAKEENDAHGLRDALKIVSGFSADLGSLGRLERVRINLAISDNSNLQEFRKSLPDLIFMSQSLSETQSLVLIASPASEIVRVDKAMKALDIKPFSLPKDLPQNPAEAYRKLDEGYEASKEKRIEIEGKLDQLKAKHEVALLALRELTEAAKNMLDDVRMAGGMGRIAMISGYVPSKRVKEFEKTFGGWMVYSESVERRGEDMEKIPTLLENRGPMKPFELITKQQGLPGGSEVDATPIISFVFPIFFGIMFGDFGHGLILTLFAVLLRQRGTGSLRQWGNMFLAAGVSATVVGILVGEFFGFSLYSIIPIPAALEIVQRPLGGTATLDPKGMAVVLEIAILIGIAHLVTGLSLDVVQAIRGHETIGLITEKLPTLTMYIAGVGFGLAFIGAGFSFNVLKTSNPAPLVGVPNSLLGGVSLGVVVVSMFVLATGKGIATVMGKSHEEPAGSAFANGAIEVFERISQFLANTISYVRLAIMLLIHASLLLAVNMLLALPIYIAAVPVIIFNLLIVAFEVLIVYIQDLRLHIYEFFTKFYGGAGIPFRKILPDRVRIKVNWL